MKIILRMLAILCFLSAAVLTIVTWGRFRSSPSTFPQGTVIADIPVDGLTADQARERLELVYSSPVEIQIDSSRVQVKPENLGFQLKLDEMLVEAQSSKPTRQAFWGYLWNQRTQGKSFPLQSTTDTGKIKSYFEQELIPRYSQPVEPSRPIPGTWQFQPGAAGQTLAVDPSIPLVETALRSPSSRIVPVKVSSVPAPEPSMDDLQWTLQHILERAGFSGIAEIYLKDLKNDRTLHFATQGGVHLDPDIAFTAASTMKIPIMISTLRRTAEPTPDDTLELFKRMVTLSENPPADTLMERIDAVSGPLVVSSDLEALGLKNSFIGGFFYMGAPLLKRFETPANQRIDVNVAPDIYNQTTPGDMGLLLEAIYRCANDKPNILKDAFGDEVSKDECQLMIDYLARNQTAVLLEAGVPEGTKLAHKHGWIEETDGLLHTMSDVGVVFTPGGDYVLNVYLYDHQQLLFDPGNHLVAELSNEVYNFFNVDQPYPWIFGPTQYR